ncbi:MAG TPA: 4a-hydroxytetrahydrobiopterin dehydratase [Opitutaceae bacterium]|nr:4a-hydroxytetrahydrobiopterin dehydratase [Opitutaceae bacterium]
MATPLTPPEIQQELAALPGWAHEGGALLKAFTFENFREAFSFMTRVALEAEARDHHPEWTNVYNRVTIRLSTHSAGDKVTMKDVEFAKRIQKVSWVG